MEIKRGTVVRSKAGHDSGLFMAVLETDGRFALTADGKTRTIISPKRTVTSTGSSKTAQS